MTERKFYRTVVEVVILSEEPVHSDTDLDVIHYQITNGDWSGEVKVQDSVPVDGKTMASMLEEQGSDPSFFQLTAAGEDDE